MGSSIRHSMLRVPSARAPRRAIGRFEAPDNVAVHDLVSTQALPTRHTSDTAVALILHALSFGCGNLGADSS
jgi:hypothetical protein